MNLSPRASRVVVAGGAGFIGRALSAALLEAGYEVVLLSRKAGKTKSGPVKTETWDGVSSGSWQTVLDGTAAVVNLAGASIAEGRWTPARKKIISDSRLFSTRALVAGLSCAGSHPAVFISASAVVYYGPGGNEALDENSPPGQDFLARLCADWEHEAQVAQALGMRTINLRIGVVLDKDGGALEKMLFPFKLGLGGPLGSGKQWMSWIAREDLAGLILHLIKSGVSGPVNAVAPEPVTNRDFSRALGRALKRPAFMPVPGFVLRLALGEMGGLLLSGQKVRPKRALESGYRFKFPDIDSALSAIFRP